MSKTEADYLKKIQIWWLLKQAKHQTFTSGIISWGTDGDRGRISYHLDLSEDNSHLRLYYTHTNSGAEKQDIDYKVSMEKTPCYFGGNRYWFICPVSKNGKYCGRRVGVLYLNGAYFACRHCNELTYKSRNENRNYKHYPLFKIIDLSSQGEKLDEQIKRRTWRGKPTRKQRKLEKLANQCSAMSRTARDLRLFR